SLAAANLTQTATVVDGQQGRAFPACAGPAMTAKVVAGGQTLVAFCHFDGAVWFFDLGRLTSSGVVKTDQLTDLLDPVDAEVLLVHARDLHLQLLVAYSAGRGRPGLGGVVGGRGDLQHLADRLDPELVTVGVNEGH